MTHRGNDGSHLARFDILNSCKRSPTAVNRFTGQELRAEQLSLCVSNLSIMPVSMLLYASAHGVCLYLNFRAIRMQIARTPHAHSSALTSIDPLARDRGHIRICRTYVHCKGLMHSANTAEASRALHAIEKSPD